MAEENINFSEIKLLLEKHFAQIEKQFADMRKDNAEFREQTKDNMNSFKSEINTRFDAIQTQITVMQNDITGLKHDVAGLYHWDYWLLSIILVVFAMPQIIAGIKAVFGAISEGISGIIALFRKENKS